MYIEGRLQTRSWDGKDGQKRSRTEIVADNMIMLDSPGGQSGSSAFSKSTGPIASETGYVNQSPAADLSTGAAYSAEFAAKTGSEETEELPTIVQGEDVNVEDIPF